MADDSPDSGSPPPLVQALASAQDYVKRRFDRLERLPEEGVIRMDGERFVLMRCESLYLGLFDELEAEIGDDAAFALIYRMARSIGRADCSELTSRMAAQGDIERIACGPPFFAHNGWAAVNFEPDTKITRDDECFLHYTHPNTFESEVLASRDDIEVKAPACLFSAGYSAGWVTYALGMQMHAREVRCVSCGADACEFVMTPGTRLEEAVRRLTQAAR